MVVLLTRHVLAPPWVLLEMFHAARLGKAVVPVKVEGGGYDFATAKAFLSNLEKELGELREEKAAKEAELAADREELATVQKALAADQQ